MQITSGWLNLSSEFLFLLCTPASGCWRQVQHIGFSLGGHCFPLLFPAGEFAGVGAILLHIGGYPTRCVRLSPMGVFQWHRGELCTLSCGRRDGLDGGTHTPGSKYLGITHAGTVNAKSVSDLIGLDTFKFRGTAAVENPVCRGRAVTDLFRSHVGLSRGVH